MVIYESLIRLMKEILKYGILSYDDAYYLASTYLNAHTSLQNLFSKRFAFVFIDEMQDTNSTQLAILGCLFDNSVVVQRIGDINQSIFNLTSVEEDCAWVIPEGDDLLEITGSKRFSHAIAKIIAPICVKPQPLTGNPQITDIAPTIIAFSDNNIKEKVIQRFGELVFEKQLHLQSKPCFKAVGWRGKEHPSKHTIQSYWPSFQKERHTKRIDYASLARYIEPECDEFIQQHSVDHYKKSIVLALLKCLRITDRPTGTPLHSERALINNISKANETFYHDLRR